MPGFRYKTAKKEMNSETRECQNCKQKFVIELEDFNFYKKVDVPPPTFCWKCRFQRRLAWRNENKPFWNVSAKSGKKIISIYPLYSGMTVYDEKEWRADDWEGLDYGVDYDFSRPFFEQITQLYKRVPVNGPHTEDNVNCEYVICSGWSKNCYLIHNTSGAEDSAYGNAIDYSKSCFDNSHIHKCERCYGSFWIRNSYQSHFCTRSIDNTSVMFCSGSKGLTNCFGCVNQINKSHCIYNVQYSKDEYFERIKAMKLNTWSGLEKAKAETAAFALKFPVAYINGILHDNVTGEYISESKNVHYGYLVNGGKDLKYVQYLQVPGAEDSHDITIWGQTNVRAYENCQSGMGLSNSHFLKSCWAEVVNSEYCLDCRGISDCFGCVGLKKKQYCIFNRQYSKQEYEALRRKIIAHMDEMPYVDKKGRVYKYGEFFPAELASFEYNVSLAQEHFPLTKEQVIAEGYRWYEPPPSEYKTTMTALQIPDAIEEVPDSILKEILECVQCKRAYRIIKMELDFLRQEKLPVPRQCVDCRHNERISRRAKAFLYHRSCQCAGKKSSNGVYANFGTHFHGAGACPNEFETTHEPNSPEIIYCLKCFWSEIA